MADSQAESPALGAREIVGAKPPEDLADDPKAFILQRTRSEVYLLLDFVSASSEASIADTDQRGLPPGLPADWIEQVCQITWPPEKAETAADLAHEASLLLRARDHLNHRASPANGATIAFTLLVTQEESAKARPIRKGSSKPDARSRSSLAREAYPDLVARADGFRFVLKLLIAISLFTLATTLFFSWYLVVTNAALTDYATARGRLLAAETAVSTAEAALNGDTTARPPSQGSMTAGVAAPPPALTNGATTAQSADQSSPASHPANSYARDVCGTKVRNDAYPSAALRDACAALDHETESFGAVIEGLKHASWSQDTVTAAWVANVLGTAVLPVLYGFLGAIAAVVRTLSRRIRGSLLSPRDAQLSIQQLALGALIGACVSLFIGAPAAATHEPSLLGPVGLSAPAISFIAGFGVDSVFQAIEALISRIFNIAPAGTAAPPPAPGR